MNLTPTIENSHSQSDQPNSLVREEGLKPFDSQESIISIENLNKFYGKFHALKNINLKIQAKTKSESFDQKIKGNILGILGPNGAGKTSLLKCLLNLTPYKSGLITIGGVSASEPRSRMGICYLPEKFQFYSHFKVKDTLNFFANMNQTSLKNQTLSIQEQINLALKKFDLEELSNSLLSKISKGQLQKVGLSKMLLGDYQIIILDEPFSGLDPIASKDLKKLLIELSESGKTLIVNSHAIHDVEQFCDEVAIINKGQLLVHMKTKDILKEKKKSLEEYFYQMVKPDHQN
jgi:ABC-2 type transport system ATP-binding protein